MTRFPGTLYLFHFDEPYKHARHYLGWTQQPEVRFEAHLCGNGSRLVAAVVNAGIGITVARTWKDKTRNDERRIKKRRQPLAIYCPVCSGAAAFRRATFRRAVGNM